MAPRFFKKAGRRAALMILLRRRQYRSGPARAPQQDMESLLDKLSRKTKASSDYRSSRASVLSTITKTDKSGTPEDVTVVTKSIGLVRRGRAAGRDRQGPANEKGEDNRHHAEIRRRETEGRERMRQRRAEGAVGRVGRRSARRRGDAARRVPAFSEKRRKDFEFRLQDRPFSEGPAVSVLEARAKVKDPKLGGDVFL